MEPTESQFKAPQKTIFRKGDNEADLRSHALEQGTQESTSLRGKSNKEVHDYETERGITGAKTVVNLNPTVKEATENPSTLGGPVSGAALAKLKAKKSAAKATKEKEMKRR
jgi:hypothetical protein